MSGKHILFDLPLPAGWTVRLVDSIRSSEQHSCVAGPFGSSISSKYFVEEGVPVIRGSNLTDDLTRFVPSGFVFVSHEQAKKYKAQHVRSGDLVFTCWGTVGQVGLIPRCGPYPEYIISNKQLKLRPDKEIADPEYLFYYFASPQMVAHIRGRAIGAAVPGINLGILKALEVVLPPLGTQHRIASILSAYDDLIENNTRRIAILEEMARRIYEEWFVHFRFPGHGQVKMVESELGLIPEEWETCRLDDVLVLQRGFDLPRQSRTDGPFPIISATGEGGTHSEFKVKGPGVVTGRSGSLGTVMYIEGDFWPLNTTLWVKKFKVGSPLYAYNVLRSIDLTGFNSGAAVPTLNRNDIHGLTVLKPDANCLASFDEVALPMMRLKKRLESKNANLRATRDLLLPKLISGELDVSSLPEPEEVITA